MGDSSTRYTAPKGRPTPRRTPMPERRVVGPTLQWTLLVIAAAVLFWLLVRSV